MSDDNEVSSDDSVMLEMAAEVTETASSTSENQSESQVETKAESNDSVETQQTDNYAGASATGGAGASAFSTADLGDGVTLRDGAYASSSGSATAGAGIDGHDFKAGAGVESSAEAGVDTTLTQTSGGVTVYESVYTKAEAKEYVGAQTSVGESGERVHEGAIIGASVGVGAEEGVYDNSGNGGTVGVGLSIGAKIGEEVDEKVEVKDGVVTVGLSGEIDAGVGVTLDATLSVDLKPLGGAAEDAIEGEQDADEAVREAAIEKWREAQNAAEALRQASPEVKEFMETQNRLSEEAHKNAVGQVESGINTAVHEVEKVANDIGEGIKKFFTGNWH